MSNRTTGPEGIYCTDAEPGVWYADTEYEYPLVLGQTRVQAFGARVVKMGCGCASVSPADELARYLQALDVPSGCAWITDVAAALERDEAFTEMVAHIADFLDLAEHGTTVRGAWLTVRGRTWLEFLREELPADNATALN